MWYLGLNKAASFAWASLRQTLQKQAKDPPFQSDFSIPVDTVRSTSVHPQRVFIVDSGHQCYLIEGGTFRQPWLPGCGSAILPVGMRSQNAFDGMRLWGFERTLDYWGASSDKPMNPTFRKPLGVSTKKVSFKGLHGRWSIHEVRPFQKTSGDQEDLSPSSLFLPLDEAVFIQPSSDNTLKSSSLRRCGICGEYYNTANPEAYTPAPNMEGYEIRSEPSSCSTDGCGLVPLEGYTDEAIVLSGPRSSGPLNTFSDFQRCSMKLMGDETEGLGNLPEAVVEPVTEADNSSAQERDFKLVGSSPIIPSMNGEGLKSFSWADDSDEDW
ncbi:4dda6da2-39ac-42e1-bee1-5dd38fa63230-CDS [Sclerotinia trifoliorum]|uniref:4dda6da2-39ac-42e1-bee1-5dd38fa63230-CDS n=1 Tax=Sclerotinia trifoliorum TaxID=28548 RepID=A0A8H2VS28_9HELO|nr:4dda6da2-39ac-42e1-bee1-5dd38fa63230-CDS [Sclerotinia trifoliorum]